MDEACLVEWERRVWGVVDTYGDSASRSEAAAGVEMSQSPTAVGVSSPVTSHATYPAVSLINAPHRLRPSRRTRHASLLEETRLRSSQHATSGGTKKSVTSPNVGTIHLPYENAQYKTIHQIKS